MAITHSILINLFIKVGLNSFSPTSPAKYCFCLRESSSGRFLVETRKARKNGEPGYEFVTRIEDHEVGHFSFEICWCLFFHYRLLLTRRRKLVEVFMTVVMYRSQQHG